MTSARFLGGLAALLLAAGCADDAFLRDLAFACDAERPCAAGWTCGGAGVCVRSGAGTEPCNGRDDDGDGRTDEGLAPEPCERTEGVCAGALKPAALCRGAAGWAECTAADYGADFEATETRCDGLDNDCDGATDDDEERGTPVQDGVCAGGRLVCDAESGLLSEDYRALPDWEAAETRCDGLDNDCDGATDEPAGTVGSCGACGFRCRLGAAPECRAGACFDAATAAAQAGCGHWLGPEEDGWDALMCPVPADRYPQGDPPRDVELTNGLLIDRYEVTNARYERFVASLAEPAAALPRCEPAAARDWAESAPHYPAERADHPVVCVTRAQAEAFCAWAGKRLPRSEEWEAAARGTDERTWPWGDAAPVGRANCLNAVCHDPYPPAAACPDDTVAAAECVGTAPVLDAADPPAPTLPAGLAPCGAAHMAGNVAEWVTVTPETWGVVRGGSWYDAADDLATWAWEEVGPGYAKVTVGFRCAATGGD